MNTKNHHLIPLLFSLLAMVALASCSPGQAAGEKSTPPRQVRAGEIEFADFANTVRATGRLANKEEYPLSFKTGGVIQRIHVREGQTVRKGQLLAELELDEIEAQYEKAELGLSKAGIDLNNAQLALRLAERDYRNVQALFADSVATLEQLENVEVQLENARNQLKAAQMAGDLSEQDQKVAAFNLQYSRIVAPARGTILRRMAEANEIVGPGKPIFQFGSTDEAKVIEIAVTDRDIIHLALGDQAKIQFDAYPGETFTGQITELASQADPYTGTYPVEVSLDPSPQQLLSGFIGQVEIESQDKTSLARLEAGALVSADGQQGVVFVVENDTARRRTIRIRSLDGESLLVESGLENGALVVTSGAGYLEDGQPVQVVR